jgi:hypothetical protein
MKINFKLMVLFTMFIVIEMACKNKELVLGNIKKSTPLNTKSLVEIKQLMLGKWNLHYTVNFSPRYFVYKSTSSYWELTATDTLTEVYDGNIYSIQKVTFKKSNYNTDTWLMEGTQVGNLTIFLLDSLRNDTLISTFPGTGAKRFLTRQ